MRKILLVDDEKLEREGIARLIDWPSQQLELTGVAENGVEALKMIEKQPPDIVITDIKMPVVSGLDLIQKTAAAHPDIFFIVLSGYGDYELTSQAMLFGVRHYLLKPVTKEKILDVLDDAKEILNRRETEKTRLRNLEGKLEKVLPYVKQQFLRDAALTEVTGHPAEYYQQLFHIPGSRFRLVLFLIDRKCDFIDRFALKNMAEEIIGTVPLNSIIERYVVLLIHDCEPEWLTGRLREIQRKYREYFNAGLFIAVSDPASFDRIHKMYREGRWLLGICFKLPNTTIVFRSMAAPGSQRDNLNFFSDLESVCHLVDIGKIGELKCHLDIVFDKMEKHSVGLPVIRSYCKKMIRTLLNFNSPDDAQYFATTAAQMDAAETTRQIGSLMKTVTAKIASRNIGDSLPCRSPIVEEMIRCIYENIDNSRLSLGWLARDVLFMNEDYLGRLFQREMHEKFSQFVLRVRLEMAKKLIENTHDLKIYEISRMIGFAEDAQYFSRVFKCYTQYTPTEYKRKVEKQRVGMEDTQPA